MSPEMVTVSRSMLEQLNGQQLGDFLKLYSKNHVNDLETCTTVAKILQNENRYISQKAYNFLMDVNTTDSLIINKLKAYKNNQNLTIADVKLLAEEKFDQKIFDLTDAAANKNRKQFIKLADEYLSSDVEPAYILTFLIRQFRMMARAKSLLGKNPTVNLALEIKIHPFVAQKLKTQISNYSIAEIKNIYRKLLKIDIKLKQGYFSPELLFTQLI